MGEHIGRLNGTAVTAPILGSEIKFLVDAAVGVRVRDWAREHLPPDPHGTGPHGDQYRITSVYLDTPEGDVFLRRGSYGRSKYRIRRYEEEPTVFLERKLRTGSRLAKRRTSVSLGMLPSLEVSAPSEAVAALWFQRRLEIRRLQPVCQVAYMRSARMATTPNGAVRLTLDEDLAALATDRFSFVTGAGTHLLAGQMILELKYARYMPALFRQLVEEFALTPGAASKYRFAVAALGAIPMHA